MRVLVTGSTKWQDRERIKSVLLGFPPETVFVTGDCEGVDALTIACGAELGFRVDAMRKTAGDADRHPGEAWKGLNERMIAAGVSHVLAFHADLGKPGLARGSRHAIDLAADAGIPVDVFTS